MAHYQIDDALGQWPDGRSGSAHYQIDPGFWPVGCVVKTQHLYLPVALSAGAGQMQRAADIE